VASVPQLLVWRREPQRFSALSSSSPPSSQHAVRGVVMGNGLNVRRRRRGARRNENEMLSRTLHHLKSSSHLALTPHLEDESDLRGQRSPRSLTPPPWRRAASLWGTDGSFELLAMDHRNESEDQMNELWIPLRTSRCNFYAYITFYDPV